MKPFGGWDMFVVSLLDFPAESGFSLSSRQELVVQQWVGMKMEWNCTVLIMGVDSRWKQPAPSLMSLRKQYRSAWAATTNSYATVLPSHHICCVKACQAGTKPAYNCHRCGFQNPHRWKLRNTSVHASSGRRFAPASLSIEIWSARHVYNLYCNLHFAIHDTTIRSYIKLHLLLCFLVALHLTNDSELVVFNYFKLHQKSPVCSWFPNFFG